MNKYCIFILKGYFVTVIRNKGSLLMNLVQRMKKALHESVDREGSQANLSRRTGVSTSVINFFMAEKEISQT